MKYRKKPVVIEAVKFDGVENVDDTPSAMFDGSFCPPQVWLQRALALHEDELGAVWADGKNLKIQTLEGEMLAIPGDYIGDDVFGVKRSRCADAIMLLFSPAPTEQPCAVKETEG